VGDACGIQVGECFADVACDRDGDRAPMIFGPGDGRIEPLPLHPRRRQVDRPDPRSTVGARKTDWHRPPRAIPAGAAKERTQSRSASAVSQAALASSRAIFRATTLPLRVSSAPDLARFAAPNPIEGGEPPPRRLPIANLDGGLEVSVIGTLSAKYGQ